MSDRNAGESYFDAGVLRAVDLEGICHALQSWEPELREVWLFGSRRHGTGSKRSDIDILVRIGSGLQLDFNLIQQLREREPYVDCFVVSGGVATSVSNGSHISASSWRRMKSQLKAVLILKRPGFIGGSAV
jgi:predicted nucleotidyltransferase